MVLVRPTLLSVRLGMIRVDYAIAIAVMTVGKMIVTIVAADEDADAGEMTGNCIREPGKVPTASTQDRFESAASHKPRQCSYRNV